MLNPNPLPKETRQQRMASALHMLSHSTGLKVTGEQFTSLTPNWVKAHAQEKRTPGRPSNDSAKLVFIKDPTSPNIRMSSRSRMTNNQRAHNMNEIHAAHLVDSIISQSTDKYTDLGNKAGFEFIARNDTPRKFIESRLAYIALCSRIPFDRLVKETYRDYVKFGNAYWIKSRIDPKKNPGTVVVGGRPLTPAQRLAFTETELKGVIGGYFRADVRTMYPVYDEDTGVLISWEQRIEGKDPRKFTLEEVIHFAYKPPAGEVLGIAMCQPVLNDVLALREVEEMCIKFIYKHLFPLVVYEVPDLVGDGHGTQEDIDQAVMNYNGMAPDGMLVVTPGTKVHTVELHTIEAQPYLKYFLQRVLMGLGVSESIMGIGNSSTGQSDMLTAQMHDRVKSFQEDIEAIINLFVMMELLVEAGFDPIRRSSDRVGLYFNEIEIETEIKIQNHLVDLYTNGGITEDELRVGIKRNPLSDEDRKKLYIYTYKIPLIDEEAKIKLAQTKNLDTHQSNNQMRVNAHQASLQPAQTSVTKKTTNPNKSGTSTTVTTTNPSSTAASKGLSTKGPASNPSGDGPARKVHAQNRPSNAHGTRLGPRIKPGPADKR